MSRFKLYLTELRAPFFTASVLPVVLGSTVAWSQGVPFDWPLFFLALIGGVLLHAGTNVANDYYDHLSRNDELNRDFFHPLTGGSRLIQEGKLSPREVLTESIILFGLAAVIGIVLIAVRGRLILWLGLIGAFSGFFYSAPPFRLANRGLGELFIGLNFGLLMTLGGYFVQAGRIDMEPVLASIPLALLIVLVVYINQFQDRTADAAVGKNHWVVRLGPKRAAIGYIAFILTVYIFLPIAIFTGLISPWTGIAFAGLPIGITAGRKVLKSYDNLSQLGPANMATIALHAVTGILLTAAYLLERLI